MALARCNLVVQDAEGNTIDGAEITVLNEATLALAVLYSDRDGTTPLGNPFTAASGADAGFFVAGGAYRVDAVKDAFTGTWRYLPVGTAAEHDAEDFDPTASVIITPIDFGAVGDGVTDDTAAFQSAIDSAIAYSNTLFIPPGKYRLTDTLDIVNTTIKFQGGGKGVTILYWTTAVTAGISIVSDEGLDPYTRHAFTIADITLTTSVASGGVAIKANYGIGSPGAVYTVVPSVRLSNVDIFGDDAVTGGMADYWTTALHLIDTGAVYLDNCVFIGKQNIIGTKAIMVECVDGYNTSFFLTNFSFVWFEFGIDLYESTGSYTLEGVYLTNFEIVGVVVGIIARGGYVSTLRLSNGHINAEQACVYYHSTTRGSAGFGMSQCFVQIGSLYTGADQAGNIISLDDTSFCQINHCIIGGSDAMVETQNGILALSCDFGSVDGITFINVNGGGILCGDNGAGGGACVEFKIGPTNNFFNVDVPVTGVALATTATEGFLWVPSCAGTPTGVPVARTGFAPLVVNSTNNKLYFYSGGSWRDAGP